MFISNLWYFVNKREVIEGWAGFLSYHIWGLEKKRSLRDGPAFYHITFGDLKRKENLMKEFMTTLSDVKQAEIIEAFKSTSRYLDDLLNIDNPYFEGMVNRIYPPELQLNKANTSDTEAPFLDLHLSILNGFVSYKFMISAMTLILI